MYSAPTFPLFTVITFASCDPESGLNSEERAELGISYMCKNAGLESDQSLPHTAANLWQGENGTEFPVEGGLVWAQSHPFWKLKRTAEA